MEARQEGNTVLLKLAEGDDLFPSLEATAAAHNLARFIGDLRKKWHRTPGGAVQS